MYEAFTSQEGYDKTQKINHQPKKAFALTNQVSFLGYIISEKRIKNTPRKWKRQKILILLPPKNCGLVHSYGRNPHSSQQN